MADATPPAPSSFESLKLRHSVAAARASLGLARPPAPPARDLVGGDLSAVTPPRDRAGSPAPAYVPAAPLLPVARRFLLTGWDTALTFASSAPVTATQLVVGAALTVALGVGLARERSVLFHPALFGPSTLLTPLSAALALGTGLFEAGRRGYNLVVYGGEVERMLGGPGDVWRDGRVVEEGPARLGPDGQRRPFLEWLLSSRYLRLQAAALACVVGFELLTSPSTVLRGGSPRPYALSSALEYSAMFLFSFLAPPASTVSFLGVLPSMPTIAIPYLYCASGFFGDIRGMLAGLAGALAAAKFAGLKRGNGEDVVTWYKGEIEYWSRTAMELVGGDKRPGIGGGPSFGGAGRRLGSA
ncbi:hypothetical protein DFJ74DRAFT_367825 [Hyaloraphidium curvatum]|nr:hypothetical protein DFJ74DRAFT_367825 [Hyaloraphidium curvatum]